MGSEVPEGVNVVSDEIREWDSRHRANIGCGREHAARSAGAESFENPQRVLDEPLGNVSRRKDPAVLLGRHVDIPHGSFQRFTQGLGRLFERNGLRTGDVILQLIVSSLREGGGCDDRNIPYVHHVDSRITRRGGKTSV